MTNALTSESTQKTEPQNVCVRIADLLIGSKLQQPLCNSAGVLLVAAGTVITSQLKQRIASYGSEKVYINPSTR